MNESTSASIVPLPVDERLKKAEVIQVIRTELVKGKGTQEDLYRKVQRFYMFDDTCIGEIDDLKNNATSE